MLEHTQEHRSLLFLIASSSHQNLYFCYMIHLYVNIMSIYYNKFNMVPTQYNTKYIKNTCLFSCQPNLFSWEQHAYSLDDGLNSLNYGRDAF